MNTYTVTLTDAEVKAMESVTPSVQEWIQHAASNRARKAVDDIYTSEVARMTADPDITSIPADKEAVVLAANVQTAAERQAEVEATELP